MTVPDGLPKRERTWAFVTIALALTMAVLDGSIVNVALPNIAKDLRVDPAAVIWVINAYQLAIGRGAAAARFPRRDRRLQARLLGRARGVHAGIVRMRAFGLAPAARDGAGRAGLRRGRDHERQLGARPLHLPAGDARPRARQ